MRASRAYVRILGPAPAHGVSRTGKGTARRAPSPQSRELTANGAGLSEHQRKQMLRVASIPREDFERQVESDKPPTVTQLAALGPAGRRVT